MNVMDKDWEALADTLRQEIEGYGRLFWMLDKQHESLVNHNIEGVVATAGSMSQHTEVLNGLRYEREAQLIELWKRSGKKADMASVKDLMGLSPGESSPMFEELLGEVSRLVVQSRKKLQYNQILLNMFSVLHFSQFNGEEMRGF